MSMHEHDWQRVASVHATHFVDEPNSRRRSRPVHKLICIACAQRGFRYDWSRVVYTWTPDQTQWETGDG